MIESFLLKLLGGIAMMWLLMPRKEVTDGFFRIQMLVALGLSVLLALIVASIPSREDTDAQIHDSEAVSSMSSVVVGKRSDSENRFLCITQIITAVIAYAGHIVWKLGRRLPGNIAIYSISFLSFLSLWCVSTTPGLDRNTVQFLLSNLTSAGVLGATLTGMLLGHWYLTTPTMSIGPLSWFTTTLAVAAVLRLVMTGIAFGRFGFVSQDIVHLLWLIMRIVGGILIPLATSIVVAKILKYRNTQSATGVLFAALILVFMGEMAAALLERDLRIPY
jgi:hypothetical protein